jgi:serine/threonine protein kinase
MRPEIESLLLDWEERRQRGEVVAVDTLCATDPSNQAELRRWARLLEACDKLLLGTGLEDESLLRLRRVPKTLGPYEVHAVLGGGGMGVVYAGWDPVLQRRVALKVLWPFAPWLTSEERERLDRRFGQEAQVLAQLKHPYIVPIYAATVQPSGCCIVMEQVRGGSLVQHRERLAAAGPHAVAAFVEKVARAVHHAHENGILHRDLKPANILLDEAGEPRVSDFGLAKILREEGDGWIEERESGPPSFLYPPSSLHPCSLTQPGQVLGTPVYMAPEQFDPALGPMDRTTDVWSLGVVLYELLTGRRPFEGETREALSAAVRGKRPVPPRKRRPGIPRKLASIVMRCLAKNPLHRYPTAEALADALAQWRRRRRLFQWSLTCLGIVTAAVAVLGLIVCASQPERRYERRTGPILTRLERGEEVELIRSDDEVPAHRIRCGEAHTRVGRTPEGITVSSPALGVVEFLPRVPAGHYRVVAELRHDLGYSWTNGMGGVGVTFSGQHVRSPAGTQHVIGFVSFDDWIEVARTPPLPEDRREGRALMQLLWYLDAPTNNSSPFKMDVALPSHESAYYKPPPRGAQPLRTVYLEIGPNGTTALWEGKEKPLLGPLSPDFCRMAGGWFRKHNPECEGVDFSPLYHPVVGVLVAGGQCTVHRLRVVPLPNPSE